jgi:ATP-dependent protease Clp ATPase subunit
MSFAVLSAHLKKSYPSVRFVIDDKNSVNKTFPSFWQYLSQTGVSLSTPIRTESNFTKPFIAKKNIILIGDRGSAKTTIGKYLAHQLGYHFIDLDEVIS